jgi:DNA repair ATPase RecN
MTTTTAELIEVKPISGDSAKEFNDGAMQLSDWSNAMSINNQHDYEGAATLLKSIKDMSKKAEDARKKITTPLDQAKAAVMDLFRPTATALENCEKHVKGLMITYSNEQERIRKVEEERLRKIAQAEEDRQRKIKEKQEAEWRAKEEKARKEAEELAKAGNAEAARKAQEEADKAAAKAEERRQQAAEVFVPAPTIASSVEKPQGVSMKKNWKARVIDINKVPRNYMIVNEKMLDGIAKSTKGSLKIEGIEFYSEDVLAIR